MPRLSILFIRTSFLYLLLGVTFGALLLTAKAMPGWGWAWTLFGAHVELMAYGWMLQFVLGIAFWALPRYLRPPKRGDERPVWGVWIAMNSGILLILLDTWFHLPGGYETGTGLQVVAVLLFAFHAWPRVKPLGW